jgi:phospholipid/cholesterol/gamma-HCH transport system ATP-binding protein
MAAPLIELRHVTFGFNGRRILDDVSMAVEESTTKVILGASGAGKSTILKLITGLLLPEAGEIIVLGQDVTRLKGRELRELRHRIGIVFQGSALFDSLTVGENVGYCPRENHNVPLDTVRTRVRETLSRVGLGDISDMMPAELSGGMCKRVAIARSIICSPRVMLYDEPTTGLDPIFADTITHLINSLKKDLGVTSITVTHIMRDAYMVADTLAMLQDGKLIFDGTAAELKAAQNPYIREFIS